MIGDEKMPQTVYPQLQSIVDKMNFCSRMTGTYGIVFDNHRQCALVYEEYGESHRLTPYMSTRNIYIICRATLAIGIIEGVFDTV